MATTNEAIQAGTRAGHGSETLLFTILRIAIGWHLLYEGLIKLTGPDWSSSSYLSTAEWIFSGFFKWIAATPWILRVVDWTTIVLLILSGSMLILGVLTRWASLAGAALLALFYIVHPPFGQLAASVMPGSYLIIDRNLIEALTLAALACVPGVSMWGVDRLRGERHIELPGETALERIVRERRELVGSLAGVPVLGAIVLAVFASKQTKQAAPSAGRNRDSVVASPTIPSSAGPALSETGYIASVRDFEMLAPRYMSKVAWEFVDSGAGDDQTVRWNNAAYSRIYLHQHTFNDVSKIDTRIKMLGVERPHPIMLSPVSNHNYVHPDAERGTARGAGAAHAIMTVSTFSGDSIEEIARAASGPLWHATYLMKDRAQTLALIRRAEAALYQVIVVPCDTPVVGPRDREHRSYRFRNRKPISFMEHPVNYYRYPLTWKDIEWYRAQTKLPLFLKGIMNPDDADQAIRLGANGIYVSNHGGRNIDTVPATIDVLTRIADKVAGRIPIIIDGGIRRGTDVLKALALGATAVSIGRPYIYALAIKGPQGVTGCINILRNELEMAMAQCGRPNIQSIDRSVIESRSQS